MISSANSIFFAFSHKELHLGITTFYAKVPPGRAG
jgi:hypothetical protein